MIFRNCDRYFKYNIFVVKCSRYHLSEKCFAYFFTGETLQKEVIVRNYEKITALYERLSRDDER